jgi:hypothetical protein
MLLPSSPSRPHHDPRSKLTYPANTRAPLPTPFPRRSTTKVRNDVVTAERDSLHLQHPLPTPILTLHASVEGDVSFITLVDL